MATTRYYGTGRRKSSVARVYLVPGTGKVTINKKDMDEYFGYDTLKVIARQPLELTSTADKFDVLVNVHGGGYTGQAGAIRHGIARALLEADPEFRPALKKAGYLTRDPLMKERKKYGLKKARRAPQFSKRYFRLPELQISNSSNDLSGEQSFGRFFCRMYTRNLLHLPLWIIFRQIHINFINLCSAYASKICVQLTKNFLAKTSTKILRYYIQQELDKLLDLNIV